MISPSRCSLTRIVTWRLRWCQMRGNSCPCHNEKTAGIPSAASRVITSSPMISTLHVAPTALRSAAPATTAALPSVSRRCGSKPLRDKLARHLRYAAGCAGIAELLADLAESFQYACALRRCRIQKLNELGPHSLWTQGALDEFAGHLSAGNYIDQPDSRYSHQQPRELK